MHKNLSEPHVLLASKDPQKLIRNLRGILTERQLGKIQQEIDKNVVWLFKLGLEHYSFAKTINNRNWRQRISRLYYGAYNIKRALQLKESGAFATDVSDHKTIDELPDALENVAVYKARLKTMRDDRNLADYSHLAREDDLLIPADETQDIVSELIVDAKKYFATKNIQL